MKVIYTIKRLNVVDNLTDPNFPKQSNVSIKARETYFRRCILESPFVWWEPITLCLIGVGKSGNSRRWYEWILEYLKRKTRDHQFSLTCNQLRLSRDRLQTQPLGAAHRRTAVLRSRRCRTLRQRRGRTEALHGAHWRHTMVGLITSLPDQDLDLSSSLTPPYPTANPLNVKFINYEIRSKYSHTHTHQILMSLKLFGL